MSIGILCLFVLVVASVAISIAALIINQQRKLKEKKMQYLSCSKKRDFHQNRYQGYQKEIERLKSNYNKKLADISFLSEEISNKKQVIKEVLEILREETRPTDYQMEHDSSNITDRRKGMIKKYWQELDGRKALYLEKLNRVLSDQLSLKKLKVKKDDEFQKFSQLQSQVENLKEEYLRLARNPVLPFKIERT